MKNITYTLTFHSEWHCGSGLATGADLDALVVKDRRHLPFVPGKTIKGLVREAVENVLFFQGKADDEKRKLFIQAFGNAENADWNMMDHVSPGKDYMRKGETFFTNAELAPELQEAVCGQGLSSYLYRSVTSTAIGEDGITVEHSLRRMETVVPCELTGRIINVPDGLAEEMKKGLRFIKRLGLNRNRGLGRCEFQIKKEE